MPIATTTEAGRQVVSAPAREIMQNATADRAARIASARRAADTLTPGDAPLFPETPAETPAAPVKPARPTTLAEAAPWLLKPFARQDVELKPTATTKDKTKALASPYADMRVYFVRLDKICGAENWSHTITLSERGAVCALTIFGVTKSAAGDYPQGADENPATSAESQAFKRACTAFGLGRYLYSMQNVWGEYSQEKRCFIDPVGIVRKMYASLDCDAEK